MPCEGTSPASVVAASTTCGLREQVPCPSSFPELGEVPMSIVGAIGVHHRQLAFEYLDTATVELKRGPVVPPDREQLQAWSARSTVQDRLPLAPKSRNWPTWRAEVNYENRLLRATEWSGWPDLNRRPLRPERSALPSCATPRRPGQTARGRTFVSLADVRTPLRGHIQAVTGDRETQSAPYQRRAWPVTPAMVAKSRSRCSSVRPNSSRWQRSPGPLVLRSAAARCS
jgi:hypothetical protein